MTYINSKEREIMSDKETKHERQDDFFSNMMFGQRPKRESEPESEPVKTTQDKDEKDATQIEQVIELVQSMGPVIEQLAPVAIAAKSFLSKKLKEFTSDSSSSKDKGES